MKHIPVILFFLLITAGSALSQIVPKVKTYPRAEYLRIQAAAMTEAKRLYPDCVDHQQFSARVQQYNEYFRTTRHPVYHSPDKVLTIVHLVAREYGISPLAEPRFHPEFGPVVHGPVVHRTVDSQAGARALMELQQAAALQAKQDAARQAALKRQKALLDQLRFLNTEISSQNTTERMRTPLFE